MKYEKVKEKNPIKSGDKFGFLTIIDFDIKIGYKKYYKCLCQCGNIKSIIRGSLLNGHTKSCGCHKIPLKHNMSFTDEYQSWGGMIQRCNNPNNKAYKDYGGRGIKVCKRWRESFEEFYKDMGDRPENLTLDRINNNLNYSCGKCEECLNNNWKINCRWATDKIQSRNKRQTRLFTFNGKTQCLKDWAKEYNLKYNTIIHRLNTLKWNFEKSLITPIK